MKRILIGITGLSLVLAGCVSYQGSGLVAGTSNAAQVEAVMGPPAMKAASSDGGSVLYYPRGPLGRHTFAVVLGPDGTMRGIEQRLTLANIYKLRVGSSSAKEVRELLGPPHPSDITRLAALRREVWEYKWLDHHEKRVLWVQFSDDGILREAMNSRDDYHESPGGAMP
jgi:hypothetical protein